MTLPDTFESQFAVAFLALMAGLALFGAAIAIWLFITAGNDE